MSPRPLLIGMNNPISQRPGFALWPMPPGCTGHRIWEMLCEHSGASQWEYTRTFDRMNLVIGRWDRSAAFDCAHELVDSGALAERAVILLGQEVRRAFDVPRDDTIAPTVRDAIAFYQIPHPSGMNRWYNDPENAQRVGKFLAAVYEEARCAAQ